MQSPARVPGSSWRRLLGLDVPPDTVDGLVLTGFLCAQPPASEISGAGVRTLGGWLRLMVVFAAYVVVFVAVRAVRAHRRRHAVQSGSDHEAQ